MSDRQVYSYHTFLYPFLWDNGGAVKMDAFREMLREGWEQNDMIEKGKLTSVEKPKAWLEGSAPSEEQRLDYQTFQYFNAAARKALFGADGDIVHNYTYRPAETHEKAKYRIFHRDLTVRSAPYELDVNYIRLKLFNTGVGILAFELEYPMPEGGCEAARQDVRAINEFGRRIYPEFLPKDKKGDGSFSSSGLCASGIELQIGTECLKEPIQERAEAHLNSKDRIPAQSYLRDPLQKNNFIRQLLFEDGSTTTVVPAVDDRMFVCCCIADSEYTDHFLGYPAWPQEQSIENRQNASWKFLTDWKTGKELYGLTNIDYPDSSCQNRLMLNQYFEEQLYLRWIEYGTLHAVTNHSMVCLTSPAVQDSVINPFLTLYIEMAILVLAQRASLISFDAKITKCVSAAQDRNADMLRQLIELSEKYAVFQGELLIQEVTSQIQGIEVYEKLQKMLFVRQLETNIQRQMRNLYEIAQSRQAEEQEEKQKRFENALAIFGIGFTLITAFSACIDLRAFLETFGWESTVELSKLTIKIVALIIGPAFILAVGVMSWKKKE